MADGSSSGSRRTAPPPPGLGPTLLAACGGDDDDASTATSGPSAPGSSRPGESTATAPTSEAVETEGGVKLSRPDNPATLPTFDDIEPIADGLAPETGTLKVFNYEEYIASATAVRGGPLRRSAGHVAANPSKEML